MSRPIDRQTVDRLVVEQLPTALRVARRLVGDADAAEDVMQESLYRVIRRWRSYRGEAEFSTWMMQIVVNVVRQRRRQNRETAELTWEPIAAHFHEPADEVVALELGQRIRTLIDALPDRQREVAALKFGEGLEIGEVASILQITEANVNACVHLVRKRIAKALGVDYVKRT